MATQYRGKGVYVSPESASDWSDIELSIYTLDVLLVWLECQDANDGYSVDVSGDKVNILRYNPSGELIEQHWLVCRSPEDRTVLTAKLLALLPQAT